MHSHIIAPILTSSMDNEDIFSYIVNQESTYQVRCITITDGYDWNMYRHIKLSTLYKNGQVESGNADGMKPIQNIVKPILNVAYRSEGFDVKDITIYVNDEKNYYKSFLVQKKHSRWARQNDVDTLIDDVVESYVDYGGCLVKFVDGRPEVTPLQRIAFCDQTDMLSGVICEKHQYTPDQLVAKKGWDKTSVMQAIDEALAEKTVGKSDAKKNIVPQKYIDVYELHGNMPTKWLSNEAGDQYDVTGHDYTNQVQIIAFSTSKSREEKKGIVFFKGTEKKKRYKLVLRDKVYGRALGYGGVEELFESQVWTTYSNIQIKEMLDAAAVMILSTNDKAFAENNKVDELDKNEIKVLADGKTLQAVQMPTPNIPMFQNTIDRWNQYAQTIGSATDGALAIRPATGTPFALEQLNTQNGDEMHQYRQGKIATFFDEIYRDWIIPKLTADLMQGDKWLDDLSLEEMQWVADQIANNAVTDIAVKAFRAKKPIPTAQDAEVLKQFIKDDFKKSGNKKFLQIFKDEMSTAPVDVEVNIAGKQKDLAKMTTQLSNIFRQIFANPTVLSNPAMARIFNEILEYSGLSPADFSGFTAPAVVTAPAPDLNTGAPAQGAAVNTAAAIPAGKPAVPVA